MKLRDWSIVTATLLATIGCHSGPQVDNLPALREPQGATVEMRIRASEDRRQFRYQGELIEIGDAGLLLLMRRDTGTHLFAVSWSELERIEATELPGFAATPGGRPERRSDVIDEFRLISRFPQGLSENLRTRLLTSYGQDGPRDMASLRN